MRTKDGLLELENFRILSQYLYLQKENYVIVSNGLTDLKLSMEEDFSIRCLNMNFPDLPDFDFTSRFYQEFPAIIDQLKTQKPLFFNSFDNRWEEIKEEVAHTLALNFLGGKK